MSKLLKVIGVVVGVLMIVSGLELLNSDSDINSVLGLILILSGILQCCFSWLIADTYNMVKEIKENNLPYIENLVIYTKNQVKEIKEKMDGEEEEQRINEQ